MKNNLDTKILEDSNVIFDDYFKNMNLNEDLKKIYEVINDEELYSEFDKESKLINLRNENHRRYYSIDINKLKKLPEDFKEIVDDIERMHSSIDSKLLLIEDYNNSINSKRLLDKIYRNIIRLERMIHTTVKELTKINDEKQKKFNMAYFNSLNLNNNLKILLIEKYNELVLNSSIYTEEIYENLEIQLKRKKYIREIMEFLNIEEDKKISIQKEDKLKNINLKIDLMIDKYQEKIRYLEDLIVEKSKYTEEFLDFKNFYNKIIAYDDTNYDNTKQTYEILSNDLRFKNKVIEFETLFINEIEELKKEEEFIYSKFGIKNLKISLSYITANYMEFLDEENKQLINEIINKINSNNYDINKIEEHLNKIVSYIWNNSVTDIYEYNPNEDYCFICSNNQFIDEKYETILITNKMIDWIEDYKDYQIGFICGYNNNIIYITENDDIMSVNYDDMSRLKTPIQIEQEFINFNVQNKIVLNGYFTKIEAVYYINDGNVNKYRKALELANMYKLPLIELKK